MERLGRTLLAAVLVLSLTVGVAAAETRTGGTIVVEEDETVDEDLQAFGGTVVVRGTVNGDVEAFAGSVVVTGTVNGDLSAFGGSVRVAGDVTGDLEAVGGDVFVEEGATVGGNLEAAGGSVTLDGTVEGDAEVGADRFSLGSSARVGGDLDYDAETFARADGAVVDGSVTEVDSIETGPVNVPQTPGWLGGIYGFLVNLLAGAVLLAALPAFSAGVARRATDDSLLSGGVGLLVLVGGPVVLVLIAITIIGIPLALAGLVVWGLGLWLGFVYGAFAVGVWLYDRVGGGGSPWVALLVGLLAVTLVGLVPVVGGLVEFLVLLVGLGALASGILAGFRGRRGSREDVTETPAGGTAAEPSEG